LYRFTASIAAVKKKKKKKKNLFFTNEPIRENGRWDVVAY
jgi:hypothetical protein